MGLRALTVATDEEEDEAQIQSISEMIAMLGKGFDAVGDAISAAGAELHRDFEALSCDYAVLEETRRLELLVVETEYSELDEKYRIGQRETVRVLKKLAELDRKYKYELLKTHEAEERCAGLEVKVESEVRERRKAEEKCREVEERLALEVSQKAKIEKDHAFLWENYQSERIERMRVEERCNVAEKKSEVEVSERRRVEEKYRELEERYELERLERFNVEHELNVLEGKLRLAVEERRRFEKECGELGEKNEVLMLEKLNAEDEWKVIEEKKELEAKEKRRVEKEYGELWEKHKLELLEKVKVEIMYKELEEKYRRVEKEYRVLDEKHGLDMVEKVRKEEECREVAMKYRLEVMEKRKFEEKYTDMMEKYRVDMLEMLREYQELREKQHFEQKGELEIRSKCEQLEEMIESERLLRAQLESEKSDEKVKFDKRYAALQEKYEFEKLENFKIQNEYKELMDKNRVELLAKINAENVLKECQARLEGLKEQQIAANERYEKLLGEVKKGRKAGDKEVSLECPRQNNNMESQNMGYKETLELKASGSDTWMNTKSLDSRKKEMSSAKGEMTDDRRNKNLIKSPDHVIVLEDVPDSILASEVSPQSGGLHPSGTPKFSSGGSIVISDSDDDCAPGEKKQMRIKRKRDSFPNTASIAEIKQHRKLSRCTSSAISDYGKSHILLESMEKRGTQKSCIESPLVANDKCIDGDSNDSSTSIFSTDGSEDEDGLQSMFSAVV